MLDVANAGEIDLHSVTSMGTIDITSAIDEPSILATVQNDFTNNGTLNVIVAARNVKGDFINNGTIDLSEAGAFVKVDGITSLRAGSTTNVNTQSTWQANGGVVVDLGGRATGNAKFQKPAGAQFFNGGTLSPGESIGTLTIDGDYEQSNPAGPSRSKLTVSEFSTCWMLMGV